MFSGGIGKHHRAVMGKAITFIRYLIKIREKLSTECYYVILENFKSFHNSIPKTNISFNFYHVPSSTVLDRKANTIALSFFISNYG